MGQCRIKWIRPPVLQSFFVLKSQFLVTWILLLSKLLLFCTNPVESGFQARTANCVFCSVTGRLQFRPGFISGYERSPRNYTVKLHFPQRTNKVLGPHNRARVDPFSMLGGRRAGNSLGHESALCGGSGGSVQTVDHLSLSPSLLSSAPSDSLFFLPRLKPLPLGLYFNTAFFWEIICCRAGSHAHKGWPLVCLAGAALVAAVPSCPLCHLAEGYCGEM